MKADFNLTLLVELDELLRLAVKNLLAVHHYYPVKHLCLIHFHTHH
jgi:hypothetical protein